MIRFTTIGTNFVVDWFLEATKQCPDLEYVGTYSRSIQKAKEFGEKYGSKLYFDDLEEFRKDCRFNMCTHTFEPDCAVKAHVGKEIGVGRYERYKTIYQELVDRRENKYD